MTATSPAFPLTSQWISQLQHLKRLLLDDPQHSQVWRWRIRVKVLTYLILRYGGDPAAEAFAVRCPLRPSPTIRDSIIGQCAPIRSQRELHEILLRIVEINRFKLDLSAM